MIQIIVMQEQKNNSKRPVTCSLLLITAFCALTVLVLGDKLAVFESKVYVGVIRPMSPFLTDIMISVSNFGSATAIVVVCALLLALPVTRMRFGFPVAACASATAVLNAALKKIIARPRPDILQLVAETGYGFPSGHSMNNAALYVMLALITGRLVKSDKTRLPILLLSLVIPFFIGISRIYLGVHNAADVLAGWMMGAVCALLTDAVWQKILPGALPLWERKSSIDKETD